MKKILSLLGTIALIGTSTTSLVACDNTEYTQKQLKELKEENKISINGNTLKWMAPQEKPFKQSDNKWYFVIWRGNKNHDWRIVKFNNSKYNVIDIDQFNHNKLVTDWRYLIRTLCIKWSSIITPEFFWENDNGTYFKAVYCWDGEEGEPKTPIIDPKTGEVTDWDNLKEDNRSYKENKGFSKPFLFIKSKKYFYL